MLFRVSSNSKFCIEVCVHDGPGGSGCVFIVRCLQGCRQFAKSSHPCQLSCYINMTVEKKGSISLVSISTLRRYVVRYVFFRSKFGQWRLLGGENS